MMWVDGLGHAKGLPVNPLATVLYGTGWPIVGTAVVFDDRDAVLGPRSPNHSASTSPPTTPLEPDPCVELDDGEDRDLSDWDVS